MKLVFDNAARAAAINTLRELINSGLAGNDCYDPDIFIVDAPKEQRDHADVACDILRAQFHRDGAFGAHTGALQVRLPEWVRVTLGLDRRDAPTLIVPLASRAVRRDQLRELDPTATEASLAETATLEVLIDDIVGRVGARS